jgi:hypothetical protein
MALYYLLSCSKLFLTQPSCGIARRKRSPNHGPIKGARTCYGPMQEFSDFVAASGFSSCLAGRSGPIAWLARARR